MASSIGSRLREFRVRFNYTVEDIAMILNITPSEVLAWEKGEKDPTPDEITELAKLYSVSEADLIDFSKGINECYSDTDADPSLDEEYIHNKANASANEAKEAREARKKGQRKINPQDKKERTKFTWQIELNKYLDAIFVLLFAIVYLIVGFCVDDGWALYWPLILYGFVPGSIIRAVQNKKFHDVNYAMFWVASYCLVCVMLYHYFGSGLSWLYYIWPTIFLIWLCYFTARRLDNYFTLKKRKQEFDERRGGPRA